MQNPLGKTYTCDQSRVFTCYLYERAIFVHKPPVCLVEKLILKASCLSLLPKVLKFSLSLCKDDLEQLFSTVFGSDDSEVKGGRVCAENSIILLKIAEGEEGMVG